MSHLSLEELDLIDEPKYRNYISSVDKALKNFESTSEWADLISALGKLSKVLQTFSNFNIIPRRVIIAKRLAQCLHPALPSGVHSKALETYNLIFKLVGPTRLANELFIFSAGLYPLLAHAAINVRPKLLTLYEIHLVPIAEYLKPGLSGFLNGLLPGLEEGADHYDRTSKLLDDVCLGVTSNVFFGCLWKCMAENPQIRLPAFTYILAHFDRKLPIEDQVEILGGNCDLMVHSLCTSLGDNSVLVQRSALEFLLLTFPLHGTYLLSSDSVQLLAAAITVLSRRDMSLNRRLFSWLLGNEVQHGILSEENSTLKSSEEIAIETSSVNAYFQIHAKKILIQALQQILQFASSAQPPDLKPYRVLVSLLEKPEIGPVILDDILLDVFRGLYLSNHQEDQHEELVKTSNLLFGTLEQSYIWSFAGRLFQNSNMAESVPSSSRVVKPVGSGAANFLEMCSLVTFLLDLLSVDATPETQVEYLPTLLVQTVTQLHQSYAENSTSSIAAGIELCLSLLKKIPPVHEARSEENDAESTTSVDNGGPALISSSQQQKQLLDRAVVGAQELLAKLINPGIFTDARNVLIDYATVNLSISSSATDGATLEELMKDCISSSGCEHSSKSTKSVSAQLAMQEDALRDESLKLADEAVLIELLPILKQLCLLLKELSLFPTFCAAAMAPQLLKFSCDDWSLLPDWLQLLCLACCSLRDSSTSTNQLYLTAVASLLDLTASTSSMLPTANLRTTEANQNKPLSSQVFAVVLLPVISTSQLLTLLGRSKVFQIVANRLWQGVGLLDSRQVSTELLHHLHALSLPMMRNVAEEVILASLNRQMQEEGTNTAAEKFTVLWHIGRDLEPTKFGLRQLRTFDRCLQLLLDWLSLDPPSPQRTLAENWLITCLLRNDLSRIIDPILLKLLQPDSARVSIRHVKVQPTVQPEKETNCEEDVYAISSVDGHVIYHVSPTKSKLRPLTVNRSLMTTGWQDQVAECYVSRDVVFPWQLPQHQILEQTVGLFVNPFPDDALFTTTQNRFQEAANLPVESESSAVAKILLDELIDTVVNKAAAAAAVSLSRRARNNQKNQENADNMEEGTSEIHPLHNYLLLYCQVSDAQQTLYTLHTLRSQLLCQPRLALLSLASTSIASSRSPHSALVQELLARHRKCLFGNGYHGDVSADWIAPHRSSMYLEILLQLLLYHIRSFYSNLGVSSLTRQEITLNRQVQLSCVQLLTLLLKELLPLVKDTGKGFGSYILDLLTRCRVQKVTLHATLAMLHVITLDKSRASKKKNGTKEWTLTEEIVLFNEEENKLGSNYSEATLVALVKLLLAIIALENQLSKQNHSSELACPSSTSSVTGYQRGVPVHAQQLFATAVRSALKQKSLLWVHTEFSRLMVACLPLLDRSLPTLLNIVIPQICWNLESLDVADVAVYNPPDYLITELEALTALCHYVLIDSNIGGSPAVAGSAGLLSGLSWGTSSVNGSNASHLPNGHILHNLVHAFTPGGTDAVFNGDAAANDPYATARKNMLSNLPRILVCIGRLWKMSDSSTTVQRQKLLEFVSPIAHHHGVSLLAAISVAWVEKKSPQPGSKSKIIPESNAEQLALVDLVSSVRVLPPDTLVQLLRQVLKQPLNIQQQNRGWRLEVGLLHFFHAYLRKVSRVQLTECWSSLLQLLRDITTMAPPVLFAALVVFGEAVQRYQTPGEKRDQRELQEVTGKLLEACGAVAAACLEQTTWLRRNLSVRRDLNVASSSDGTEELAESMSSSSDGSLVDMAVLVNPASTSNSNASQYSIQALFVLAELLAPLQDMAFASQDKERVIPLLTSLLANVIPYLKHHSQSNIAGMKAASQLLSSLSFFPATRRAWRRDAFELLLDPAFFAVDIDTLRYWRNIVDNLMCHDKDAFREFLNRVSVSPSGLFSNREQEIDMRAMLLKRLAFALFCTDGDQYQRYIPDIQEKLSESLRLAQPWPTVQAQVFLCFRVLLLRTSHQHVTSLWPSVITETVQVLSQMEHELRRESDEFSSQLRRLSVIDSTWVMNTNNGLQGHAHPAWLHLYLATCKLLHLALSLPATRLPQFQMYRWAFVGDDVFAGDGDISNSSSNSDQLKATPNFIPYLTRIYRLLRNKADVTTIPTSTKNMDDLIMPSSNSMKSVMDLLPFFHAVEQRKPRAAVSEDLIISSMENVLERDFLEPIPIQIT